MIVRAWRLAKTQHAAGAFDGEGARVYGARWNSPGTSVAYASESLALATLELIVHLQSVKALAAYSVCRVQFDGKFMTSIDPGALPATWREYPAPSELQAIGDAWIAGGRSLVLRVPSVIIPTETNYLINPAHGDVASLTIDPPEPFVLDPRLLGG
ncbi:MAG TPA: RES family NAD+ phosphorylase [Gemmatimonadales bacterium]|nr:RES family NAD+ phosphorylase [Gemmatimonadales bacterium]